MKIQLIKTETGFELNIPKNQGIVAEIVKQSLYELVESCIDDLPNDLDNILDKLKAKHENDSIPGQKAKD